MSELHGHLRDALQAHHSAWTSGGRHYGDEGKASLSLKELSEALYRRGAYTRETMPGPRRMEEALGDLVSSGHAESPESGEWQFRGRTAALTG